MILITALVASITIGLIRKGSLAQLAQAELRGLPLYATAILLQVFVVAMVSAWGLSGMVYAVSFLLLTVGAYLDRRVPGMFLVALGLLLNTSVIVANGGRMPVFLSPDAPGWKSVQALTHVPMALSGRLRYLGDFIRIPEFGGHYSLLSPGDVLIAIGVFVAVQSLMVRGSKEPGGWGR
ncbi:MAG TPA: DUF5317 domain-containing protein [Firmicutes bacterium]|nr:DUF5317 domain-containing protein [Bacillota bacterium]